MDDSSAVNSTRAQLLVCFPDSCKGKLDRLEMKNDVSTYVILAKSLKIDNLDMHAWAGISCMHCGETKTSATLF